MVSPEKVKSLSGFIFGSVWVDIVYQTDKGEMREKCKFHDGDDGESNVYSNQFWLNTIGITVPVYYKPTSPDKVVFIGSMREVYGDIVVKEGKGKDWILAGICVVILLFILYPG